MSLPASTVTVRVYDTDGAPVEGARVSAKLTDTEVYLGFVVPSLVTGTTDAAGQADLELFPNELGSVGSQYRLRAWSPTSGRAFLDTYITVPDSNCNADAIITVPPYPTVDASEQALIDVQAQVAAVTVLHDETEGFAADAEASALAAAASALSADNSDLSAASHASAALSNAGQAAASASAADISAGEAAGSAVSAAGAQAAATNNANNAAASANDAANSEANAATSEANALVSETNAATSETNAANSEMNAATSETNAQTAATAAQSYFNLLYLGA